MRSRYRLSSPSPLRGGSTRVKRASGWGFEDRLQCWTFQYNRGAPTRPSLRDGHPPRAFRGGGIRGSARKNSRLLTQRLAALLHFRAEFTGDRLAQRLRPLIHELHAGLDRFRLLLLQLLAERRLVERGQVFQLLLGEIVGVDLGHLLADFLVLARLRLGH